MKNTKTMKIFVNDEEIVFSGETLEDLIKLQILPDNFVVAISGKMVKKADFPTKKLSEGNKIDILTIAEGG